METKTLTVMFADLVGYTDRTSKSTRENFVELLDTYKAVAKPVFSKHQGKIIKEIGDAYMVSFESPTNAVLCGIYLQNAIVNHNKKATTKDKLKVKVGINTGEVHVKDNDLYGDAVNIASRIEGLTPPGKIYFTESVFLSMNKNEVSIGVIGYKKPKGIKHRIRVYTVLGKYDLILRKIKRQRKRFTKKIKRILVILALIFFIGAIMLLAFFLMYYPELFF